MNEPIVIYIEDIIPKVMQNEIQKIMESDLVNWAWGRATSEYHDGTGPYMIPSGPNIQESSQFIHSFYKNNSPRCQYFGLINGVLYFLVDKIPEIEIKKLDRVKSNLMLREPLYPKDYYNTPHVDHDKDEYLTLLYYINDSDGDTFVFEEKNKTQFINNNSKLNLIHRQKPKKGSALLFSSNLLHASSPPVQNERRLVINYVFEVKK